MRSRFFSICILCLFGCVVLLCCTHHDIVVNTVPTNEKELFFTGFGPAENFVPEEVIIDFEDEVEVDTLQ